MHPETTHLIWNANSGKALPNGEFVEHLRETLAGTHGIQSSKELDSALESVLKSDCSHLLIAGGDGTIHSVVNSCIRAGREIPVGILPTGTGNNLARKLALPLEPREAFASLSAAGTIHIDLIQTIHDSAPPCYCLNFSAGGFVSVVHEEISQEEKAFWGSLAYLKKGLEQASEIEPFAIKVFVDEVEFVETEVLSWLICNSGIAGNGYVLDPQSSLLDGIFEVILVPDIGLSLLGEMYTAVTSERGLGSERVPKRRVTSCRIVSTDDKALSVSIDGEELTAKSISFELAERSYPVLAPLTTL